MKKRKVIVLARHLKKLIFGGPVSQNCRPINSRITLRFTTQLVTEVP